MTELSGGTVVSELPDLTGVALADLPDLELPHQDLVVERIADHPNNQHSEQNMMPA